MDKSVLIQKVSPIKSALMKISIDIKDQLDNNNFTQETVDTLKKKYMILSLTLKKIMMENIYILK